MPTTFRTLRLLALPVLGLVPALAAQQGTTRTQPENSRIIIRGMPPGDLQDLLLTRRARLGVTVNLERHANDSVGATISAVTPGGPAFKAGIQSGDIITRLDGTSVTAGPRPAGAEDDRSLPGLRLVEIASRLAPDATVTVEFKRGNQRRTVSLVTGNEAIAMGEFLDDGRRMFFGNPEDMRRIEIQRTPGSDRIEVLRDGPGAVFALRELSHFGDLELAPINAELGSYFGTTEGVLVVRAGERSTLGLKGGDVLLTIDGRKATSPASAMRILRSYETGETIRLEVMRNRQRQVLTSTVGKE